MADEPQIKHQSNERGYFKEILLTMFVTIVGGIAVVLFEKSLPQPKDPIIITQVISIQTGSSENTRSRSGGSESAGSSGDAPTRTPFSVDTDPISIYCPGAYGPSFRINDRFIVPYGGEYDYTTVRSQPNSGDVGRVYNGEGGIIIGGPVCKEGTLQGSLIVWKVRTDTGIEGWMAEGYPSSTVPWIEPE